MDPLGRPFTDCDGGLLAEWLKPLLILLALDALTIQAG